MTVEDALVMTVPETALLPAFEAFFAAQRVRVFRAMLLVTRDRHEADDLTQLAFCKVWERWERVGRMDDPTGYLFRVAFNAHRSALRRLARASRRVLPLAANEQDASADLEARDRAARVLAALTPRQRAAVTLTAYLGYDTASAASMLGVKPATVRALVAQARAAVTKEKEDDDG